MATTDTRPDVDTTGETPPSPPPTRGMPAGRAFMAMLVCLLVWTVLYAPELKRSAETHREGARRTISLAILSPIAWISDHVGLSAVTEAVQVALGRDQISGSTGDLTAVPVDVLPTVTITDPPKTGDGNKPVVRDTKIRVPTGDDHLRVAVVGDSLANGVGALAGRVFRSFFVDLTNQGRISTGLARSDYFNWAAGMQEIVDLYRPDLTIVMLGENDNQSLLKPSGDVEAEIGSVEFMQAYEDRVRALAEIATSRGGHVIWVGLPVQNDESRWDFIRRQNDVYREVADLLPNVAYLDSWALFDKDDGGYTAYYRDGNKVLLVRADDGLHFNADGYTILVEKIAELAIRDFHLDPKTIEE
jgi:uncharacterized protein